MSILQRIVLLFKVLVMMSVGVSAGAWAECPGHDKQAASGQMSHADLMIAKSESEPGDQGQGGSADDDDTMTDEDEGDSQT